MYNNIQGYTRSTCSDNDSNFVGAKLELKENLHHLDTGKRDKNIEREIENSLK